MGGNYRGIALSLIAGALVLYPGTGSSAGATVPWRLEARRPSAAPVHKGEGEDLRETIVKSAPTVIKGAAVVIFVTLAIMTFILVPFGWARRFFAGQAARSGNSMLPSPKKYYVKIGVLGVPSEFEWDLPHLVVGGNRFDMTLSTKAKDVRRAWDLQGGTRVEFISKDEVEAERARHLAEVEAKREAALAARKFESQFGDAPPTDEQPPPRE